MKTEARAAVFVPHLGCRNDCVFCNQRAIAGVTSPATAADVRSAAEKVRAAGAANAEIAFFGGSFTAIEHGYMQELLAAAKEELQKGGFSGIRLSTRPDCIDDGIIAELKQAGVTVIELGAQSMRDDVLAASGRGHTAEDTRRASGMIRRAGFRLGLQMMTGLPGDSDKGAVFTAKEIVKLAPDCVRIYPTVVLKSTRLAQMYERGEYTPQTLEGAVSLCTELCGIFDEAGIPVIRLGLQRTESCERDIIAGAWHPAFGELVFGERRYAEMRKLLLSLSPERGGVYGVCCPANRVSLFTGHGRRNFERLDAEFGIHMKILPAVNEPEGRIVRLR